MATIPTNISERIYNISQWRGVNEAQEGEASLKSGEAAVMRNFSVTSGGALKKRPGSLNVAGLLNGYVVKTGEEQLRFDSLGADWHVLYPKVDVDEMGRISISGHSECVEAFNAAQFRGWYMRMGARVYKLNSCREVRGPGEVAINGGMGKRGALTKFAEGTLFMGGWGYENYSGTKSVKVWPGAGISSAGGDEPVELSVSGEPVEQPTERVRQCGFVTQDVGGFFLRDGQLWEYYGLKVEDSSHIFRTWKRYRAIYHDDVIPSYWELGNYLGEGEYTNVEEELGSMYVGRETIDGKEYIIGKSSGSGGEVQYDAYIEDTEKPIDYGDYVFGWYGYPLTVTENTYIWIFLNVYADTPESTDRQVRGIWSGLVGGREVLCAACGGALWELRESGGVWEKTSAGAMDTSRDVHMFGFDDRLYILNGLKYLVWDGARLEEVEGYRPLVAVSVAPEGGGTLLENVNRLTPGRRCWLSPDGEAKEFKLPEADIASIDWVKDNADGSAHGGWTADLETGTVTFTAAPEEGVNSIEIAWTAKEDLRGQVRAMKYAELFNGAQDTRVFLYGDGSNRAFYSGLDYNGVPRADYFPDLYEVAVGDANTPITAMIRHYNKLMAFKTDSAWSIGYDTITLVDGTVTAGFYVSPVNRSIGNCAYGQAQLVQNRPRTLDGRSVIEWRATNTSGNISGDQRNAERVSQRVDSSIRKFDLSKARTFYDKFSHEYYVIGEDGTAIVQNLDVDAWYVYTGLEATCMINYRDELYFGTRDGFLRHFSDSYRSDNGKAIDAYWESGAMSFSEDFRRKYSAMVWIGIKPEDYGYLEVTARTDRKSDFAVYDVASSGAGQVPEMERIKLKAKKFTYYKLILRNNTADRTATVVSADMRVRGTGFVR